MWNTTGPESLSPAFFWIQMEAVKQPDFYKGMTRIDCEQISYQGMFQRQGLCSINCNQTPHWKQTIPKYGGKKKKGL